MSKRMAGVEEHEMIILLSKRRENNGVGRGWMDGWRDGGDGWMPNSSETHTTCVLGSKA